MIFSFFLAWVFPIRLWQEQQPVYKPTVPSSSVVIYVLLYLFGAHSSILPQFSLESYVCTSIGCQCGISFTDTVSEVYTSSRSLLFSFPPSSLISSFIYITYIYRESTAYISLLVSLFLISSSLLPFSYAPYTPQGVGKARRSRERERMSLYVNVCVHIRQ